MIIMYSASDAIKDTLAFSAEFVPNSTKRLRIEICSGCAKFKRLIRTCGECGCQVDLKAMYSKSTCPDKKW